MTTDVRAFSCPQLQELAQEVEDAPEEGGAAPAVKCSRQVHKCLLSDSFHLHPQLQELAQEVEEAPEEAGAGGAGDLLAGGDSAAARRQLHALAARAAVEEDLMMRVPLSKVLPT